MKQTHILPQIPQGITDPTVEKYLRDLQKVIRDKHEDDYLSFKSGGGGGGGADIIIKYEIEALITHWCLVDPTRLPAVYQICDGSVWKSGSYAETFWTPKGLTKIPNLCGYGLRSADRSSTQNDPDRDDRRQAVTGQVLTGGTTISLPAFYCNVIKEARDKGRTIQIGINASDMFGTLSPVGTVSNVDLATNVVTVGTALTVGATALIIKGDCIGSFQQHQMMGHKHSWSGPSNAWSTRDAGGITWTSGAIAGNANFEIGQAQNSGYGTPLCGAETRIKNISYLPIMYVLLPSQALVNINGEIRNIDALIDKIGANSYVSQIVQNHVTTIYDYAFSTTRASATILECFTTSITTVKNESKISIDMFISGETNHNGAFILERGINGVFTEIGSPAKAGTRFYGISIITHDADNATTINNYQVQYIDTPSVPSGTIVTYRLKVYGNGEGGFNVNHVISDSDTYNNERATSNVRLTEFAGTPNINFGDTDVASVSEAKAGVDNTKVITPYGLRQAFNAEGSAPVYACRAWVNFDGTGTVAIRASGNVSSITDNGIGDYTVNFTTAMPDANYGVSGLSSADSTIYGDGGAVILRIKPNVGPTVSAVRVVNSAGSNSLLDCTHGYIAIFR